MIRCKPFPHTFLSYEDEDIHFSNIAHNYIYKGSTCRRKRNSLTFDYIYCYVSEIRNIIYREEGRTDQ